MRRRPGFIAWCLSGTLVLTGCAGLPRSSTVGVGKAIASNEQPQPLSVRPDGPLPGDDPRQIAVGFLRAHMWDRGGYGLARSFLTSSGSAAWHPGTAATVFAGESGITATMPDVRTVRLSVPVVATLSADGHLTRGSAPERRTLEFRTNRTGQGWRLSSVPQGLGLWLSSDDFTRLYSSVNVYYPSAYGHEMVPDPRWLPRQGLATALARAALTVPPEWLRPAVRSPFPRGTSLDVEAVPVSGNGQAGVDLSGVAQRAGAADRSAMWASLVATVSQTPEVQSINVSSQGSRLEAENLPSTVTRVDDVGYQMPQGPADAVVARGAHLAWTDPDAESAGDGATTAIAAGRPRLPALPANWTKVALGPGGRQVAAVSRDGTALRRWVNGSDVTLGALGTDLVRPVFDTFGFLWCAGRQFADAPDVSASTHRRGPSAVWALDTSHDGGGRTPTAIGVPWLGTASVRAVSVSPDGARVAMVLDDRGSRRLVMAAVIRRASGAPVALGPPQRISGPDPVEDVVWAGPTQLAVLTGPSSRPEPALVTLDGDVQRLGHVTGARSLQSTRGGETGLFVTTASGTVYARSGSAWNSFLTGGDVVVPPS